MSRCCIYHQLNLDLFYPLMANVSRVHFCLSMHHFICNNFLNKFASFYKMLHFLPLFGPANPNNPSYILANALSHSLYYSLTLTWQEIGSAPIKKETLTSICVKKVGFLLKKCLFHEMRNRFLSPDSTHTNIGLSLISKNGK